MNDKQRLNRKIIAIIILLFGILIMCSCNQKICPTYDSAVKAKQLKKRSAYDAWNSDFCVVKQKKSKF
jgi:uncharacterized alpha/beta hydrolase family protein